MEVVFFAAAVLGAALVRPWRAVGVPIACMAEAGARAMSVSPFGVLSCGVDQREPESKQSSETRTRAARRELRRARAPAHEPRRPLSPVVLLWLCAGWVGLLLRRIRRLRGLPVESSTCVVRDDALTTVS